MDYAQFVAERITAGDDPNTITDRIWVLDDVGYRARLLAIWPALSIAAKRGYVD